MPSTSSATVAEEAERKYSTTGDRPLPDLTGLPSVDAIDVDRFELSAQYYDTADLCLLRSKITLRRREGGDDAGWHLKLPSGVDTRTELHFPLGDDSAEDVPADLGSLLRGIRRGAPLSLAALLVTRRHRHRLRSSDGGFVAEVVVDDVDAVRSADGSEIRWKEIEVEWNSTLGDKTIGRFLTALEERFAAVGITRSESPSKLHRVLGDLLPARPPIAKGLIPVRDYLSSELHTLGLSDIAVRRDARDAVHSMRKAARRLRSALQTYSDEIVVDPDLVDELRWLGRRLSPSRDLEVQWERLTDRVADIPVESHREATRARIDEYFSARSEAARLEAVDTLDSDRYVGLLTRLDAAITDIAPATEAARARPKVARKELLRAVAALSKKVSRRVDRVGDAENPAERDALMHRARKGAKRMRYAIEVIAPLHPKRSGRILDRFDDFQDLLGEFQDSVVAREHLLDMLSEQGHTAETSFGLGILFRIETEIGDAQAAHLDSGWRKAYRAARRLWT
ncbi:CYTH and CHAD domain-containing protein [Rhodococcus pyridinivorans]|uniref:CYTH and CHAD domain-containing protein n=1 Tax=Rhodococcus pyridinivorans TaxID=103816 RepID=A0A7M2XP96_9NOCA|nr:CYTH and CHAD domain-containing protein [Rhodococcus pyridinivorans]QOV99565.1 CYTH and CHAD domain-containing protein [Rhodococcus pyridinivorans]